MLNRIGCRPRSEGEIGIDIVFHLDSVSVLRADLPKICCLSIIDKIRPQHSFA